MTNLKALKVRVYECKDVLKTRVPGASDALALMADLEHVGRLHSWGGGRSSVDLVSLLLTRAKREAMALLGGGVSLNISVRPRASATV